MRVWWLSAVGERSRTKAEAKVQGSQFTVQGLQFRVGRSTFGIAPEERHVYRTEAPPQPATLFTRQNGKRRTDVGVGRSMFGVQSLTFKVESLRFGSAPEERHVYRTEAPPQPATLFTRQNGKR